MGRLLPSQTPGIWYHKNCAIWSSGVVNGGGRGKGGRKIGGEVEREAEEGGAEEESVWIGVEVALRKAKRFLCYVCGHKGKLSFSCFFFLDLFCFLILSVD